VTFPGGGDWLDGLDATTEERLHFLEVLNEVEAEIADDPGDYDPDGPWHDQAGIPGLDSAFASMDRANALDAARIGEDIVAQLDRRPSAEDRLVRAFRRIEAGTYTEAAQPGYDPGGRREDACGPLDDFGRCGAANHVKGCHQTVEASAATGDAVAAQAWRDTLLNRTPDPAILGLELATTAGEPGLGDDIWSDLLAPSLGGQDAALRAQVLAYLGEPGGASPEPVLPAQRRPDVSGVRAALGL
jgi:hypothetical protein